MAKAPVSLAGRDILDLDSLSVEEYNLVLQTASEMKKIMKRDIKKVPSLRGKSIINLFYEPSTRTRTSLNWPVNIWGPMWLISPPLLPAWSKANVCGIQS